MIDPHAKFELTRAGRGRQASRMIRKTLKWFLRILRPAPDRPGDLPRQPDLFPSLEPQSLLRKSFCAKSIFAEPELLSSLGLVEQFGITSHNGKLSDESPAHQEKAARLAGEQESGPAARLPALAPDGVAASLHSRSRLVPGARKSRASSFNFITIPSTSSSACKTSFPSSWPTPIGSSRRAIAITTCNGSARCRRSSIKRSKA